MKRTAEILLLFATLILGNRAHGNPQDRPGISGSSQVLPHTEQIVARMMEQNMRQERELLHFEAVRTFQAENRRFKTHAMMQVLTTFRHLDGLDSQVLRHEGSQFIRERVFSKILEAEKETGSKKKQNLRSTFCRRTTISNSWVSEIATVAAAMNCESPRSAKTSTC